MNYFCSIPPLNHLPLGLRGKGETFMALAPYAIINEGYRKFVRTLKTADYTILLDNGAAEREELSHKDLDKVARAVGPDFLILPDVLLDGKKTLKSADKFIDQYYTADYIDTRLIGVPQGKTSAEWLNCYEDMLKVDDIHTIGMSKIAIPHCFRWITGSREIHINRSYVISYLKKRKMITKPMHLLGMGDPKELAQYKNISLIKGADSCYPIWAAKNSLDLATCEFKRIKTNNSYFSCSLTQGQYAKAVRNIDYYNSFL